VENAREEFIPFLDYDVEIRQVICSTNAPMNAFAITFGERFPDAETY
jgi:hypothetical protein